MKAHCYLLRTHRRFSLHQQLVVLHATIQVHGITLSKSLMLKELHQYHLVQIYRWRSILTTMHAQLHFRHLMMASTTTPAHHHLALVGPSIGKSQDSCQMEQLQMYTTSPLKSISAFLQRSLQLHQYQLTRPVKLELSAKFLLNHLQVTMPSASQCLH